jgi:hypothetical protein
MLLASLPRKRVDNQPVEQSNQVCKYEVSGHIMVNRLDFVILDVIRL